MHAERDYLVKVVSPELRERLRPHRVDLVDIDLRWGITQEQAENDRVLAYCLEQIDTCRPFFIGLLGQRYGWIPDELPGDALESHGWLQRETGKSITELEILHGVLRSPAMRNRSFFYFRDPAALDTIPRGRRADFESVAPEHVHKLATLKNRIRQSGVPVLDGYAAHWEPDTWDRPTGQTGRLGALHEFGRAVLDDLWRAIKLELGLPDEPPEGAGSWLQIEHDDHRRFMEERLRGYVSRRGLHESLVEYAFRGQGRPLLVLGPSGSGKSSLLAQLVDHCQRLDGSERVLVVPHFVGASTRSTSLGSFLTRVLETLDVAFGIESEPVTGLRELEAEFRSALEQVPPEARLVLVVDAIDQFEARDDAVRLTWLPLDLPSNVAAVLSAVDDGAEASDAEDADRAGRHVTLRMPPLSDAERLAIAREVPAIAAKTLDRRQLELLLDNEATRNPLFLRVALEELKTFPSFERIGERIGEFPGPGDEPDPIVALFDQVLGRIEEDFDTELSRTVLSSLSAARRGMTERELSELTGGLQGSDELFPVLRQLRPYLMRRDDVLAFFHHDLERAARRRYLGSADDRITTRSQLADYFSGQPDFFKEAPRVPNRRKVEELPFLLLESGQPERLAACLEALSFAEAKVESGLIAELADDYHDAAATSEPSHTGRRRSLEVLGDAVAAKGDFLRRYPDRFFQVMWDRCWWHDAPAAAHFFDVIGPDGYEAPWQRPSAKVHEVLERWRSEWEARSSPRWIRGLTPPHDLYGSSEAILEGHENWVNVLEWSPSGDVLASGSYDGTARLWPRAFRGEPVVVGGHEGSVADVAWSPDGTLLATGSGEGDRGTVRVWRANGAGPTAVMDQHTRPLSELLWLPGGAEIVGICRGSIGSVWSVEADEVLPLRGGELGRNTLASRPRIAATKDGRRVAITWGNKVRVWQRGSAGPLDLEGHDEVAIVGLCWAPDGARLATAAEDHTVRVWSIDDGTNEIAMMGVGEQVSVAPHQEPTCIAWSPDGEILAAGWNGGTVAIWSRGQRGGTAIGRHSAAVTSLAWSAGGRRLATASEDGTVRIWDAHSARDPLVLRGHYDEVLCLAWSPDDSVLASGSMDCTIRIWRMDEGVEPLVPIGHIEAVNHLAWRPDGRVLASAGEDGKVHLWPVPADRRPDRYTAPIPLTTQAWSVDGRFIAAIAGMGYVLQVDTEEPPSRQDSEFGFPCGGYESVWGSWSPTAPLLAVHRKGDDRVYLVEFGKAEAVDVLPGGGIEVAGGPLTSRPIVSWSPNSEAVAGVTQLGVTGSELRIWSPEGGNLRAPVIRSDAGGCALAWSPDGEVVAVLYSDGELALHPFEEGQNPARRNILSAAEVEEIEEIYFHSCCLAWSPDGARIAVGTNDGVVRIWPRDLGGDPLRFRAHGVEHGPSSTKDPAAESHPFLTASGYVIGELLTPSAARRLYPEPEPDPSDGTMNALAWSPDGAEIATAGRDHTIHIWSAEEGVGIRLEGHRSSVVSLAWAPDGRRLATVEVKGELRIWRMDEPEMGPAVFPCGGLSNVVWLSATRLAVDDPEKSGVVVWNTVDGEESSIPIPGDGAIWAMEWSEPRSTLVVASSSGYATVLGEGAFGPHEGIVSEAAWCPDGSRILTVSERGVVRVWPLEDPRRPVALNDGTVHACAWSPDGRRLATFTRMGALRIWSVEERNSPILVQARPLLDDPVSGVQVERIGWPEPDAVEVVYSDEVVQKWVIQERDGRLHLSDERESVGSRSLRGSLAIEADGLRTYVKLDESTLGVLDKPLKDVLRCPGDDRVWAGVLGPSVVVFRLEGRVD